MLNLSQRLKLIASLVPFGARVCDIGTDHGYLSIELVKSGKAKSVIATDVNQKPLATAQKNITQSNVTEIDLRLCDGLSGILPNEVDTVVIAGMGGEVISGILERGKSVVQNKNTLLILQPTTSPEFLRGFLFENGYEIKSEYPLCENGKLYSVMLCEYTDSTSDFDIFSKYIGKITPKTPDGCLYIEKQFERCRKCMEALRDIPQKSTEFEFYKSVCDGITDYLNSFKE